MNDATFVIVGANLAGGAAAQTLRAHGFDGRLVLIGAEALPPYERPPLSKEYLRGEKPAERTRLLAPEWYADNDVDLRLGVRVARLDVDQRAVELEGDDRVAFDRLLLATGGRNRRLSVPGADLPGVFQLRTLADADDIRAEATPGRTAVVVGAGFIGSEVTASLRSLGVEVELLDPGASPLLKVLGPEISALYLDIHRAHGVRFHPGQHVAEIRGEGRAEAVVTREGLTVEGDFVVAGVGIEPVTELAEGTPLAVDNGILVDAWCRTNVEGIFAAGDVANHDHPLFRRRMRVEHWDNALKQGAAAARSMLGEGAPYDDPHWFWSDQYDHNLQYVGHAVQWDEMVVRGRLEERSFVAFYLNEGRVEGVVGMDRGKDVRRARGLVRKAVEPALLKDEDVDLKALGRAADG
jgi:3-phenylpropionate/trans-cinnamate dioxygenase ferredoxin reductase subunit